MNIVDQSSNFSSNFLQISWLKVFFYSLSIVGYVLFYYYLLTYDIIVSYVNFVCSKVIPCHDLSVDMWSSVPMAFHVSSYSKCACSLLIQIWRGWLLLQASASTTNAYANASRTVGPATGAPFLSTSIRSSLHEMGAEGSPEFRASIRTTASWFYAAPRLHGPPSSWPTATWLQNDGTGWWISHSKSEHSYLLFILHSQCRCTKLEFWTYFIIHFCTGIQIKHVPT